MTTEFKRLGDCCRVKYVISSHVRYRQPLENALNTMKEIPDDDKCIVVAGSLEEKRDKFMNVTEYSIAENAYELSALIHASQHPDLYEGYEYILLLHDTIECSSDTKALVENHPATDFDISFVCNPARTNMGLYRISFLVSLRDVIAEYNGMSKQRAMNIEILEDDKSLDKFTEKVAYFPNAKFTKDNSPTCKYSSDLRWGAHISSINIRKWYKRTPVDQLESDLRHRP